ncbi:MAG TPA: hypothetical protein VGP47_11130 [Parachlamydiaceae bacterium]|nr:hypothetical protein [Parachlamydiaceae bacterium]
MKKSKNEKSKIKSATHKTPPDPQEGGLPDKQTKSLFDVSSLTPTSMPEFMAQEIRAQLNRKNSKISEDR